MSVASSHLLEGLEPDNLLAFLALLGLLRALEAAERDRPDNERFSARAAWDLDKPPLRPKLFLMRNATQEEIAERAAKGVALLAATYDFAGRKDLNHTQKECRNILEQEAKGAQFNARERIELLAALMSDAAINDKDETVDPTPLCLLSAQGHQHFLERLSNLPSVPTATKNKSGRKAVTQSAAECLSATLFKQWLKDDYLTSSFRWDPDEDVRYALMAGDPTDTAYKSGTQHGANRLAAIGLAALTLVPETRAGRVRPSVIGGASGADGFSFAWPIWREPATLSAIRALLAHPDLRRRRALAHLGVDHVVVAQRISVGKFTNFSRARPVAGATRA